MAAICRRWGCLKKARRVKMGGIPKKKKDILESQGHNLEKTQRNHRTNRLSKGRIFQSKSEVAILTWPVKFGSYWYSYYQIREIC